MQSTYGLKAQGPFLELRTLHSAPIAFLSGELIPEMTKVAWQSKRSDIQKLSPGMTSARFRYQLPRKKVRSGVGQAI